MNVIEDESFWHAVYGGGHDAVEAVREYLAKRQDTLDDITDAFTKQRWVPVGERLPEESDGEYVLVTNGEVVGMATHRTEWSHAIGRDGWMPTHWMPLPEPPEAKR